MSYPANTKHLYNICTMLDQRRRRWSNIVQMLYKCFVLAGYKCERLLHIDTLLYTCTGLLHFMFLKYVKYVKYVKSIVLYPDSLKNDCIA